MDCALRIGVGNADMMSTIDIIFIPLRLLGGIICSCSGVAMAERWTRTEPHVPDGLLESSLRPDLSRAVFER